VIRKTTFVVFLGLMGMSIATVVRAQDPSPNPDANAPQQRQGGFWTSQEGGPRPLFGRITAMHDGSLEITRPDGQVVTVKVTSQTEFRKDRAPAKATDFRVGDMVMVRGDENSDHTVTAKSVGTRTGGQGGMIDIGTFGKDYVIGEVKSIDTPRLTVTRPDNVTQTLELNEDTSLRKGRESITMADIQVGDHVMARGAVQNDVFVPKGLMVMNPEQWKRFQEFAAQSNANKTSGQDAPPAKPQE
jgi:hypothetical protein